MSTLSAPAEHYVASRRARGEITRKTAKNMRYVLRGFADGFGGRPAKQLTQKAIERWLETTVHLSPATRRLHLSVVRGFCRWLVDEKFVGTDPTAKVSAIRQPRSMPRTLSHDEVARLYAACDDRRARAMVALMVGCGLRCVEVSRLDVGDYDPQAHTLEVVGKGGHERIVHVPAETVDELDAYITEVGAVSGRLIRSRVRAEGLTAGTISTYMSRLSEKAGVRQSPWDGRTAHSLRRTAASDVMESSNDPWAVAAMLGHKDHSSLGAYVRRAQIGRLREVMEGRDYRSAA